MTWGQIRFLLQKFASGASLDTIDHAMNARYERMLSLLNWKGLEKTAVLETVAAVTAGTVTVASGSTSVVGTGTGWDATAIGKQLILPGSAELYGVTGVNAATQTLTLDRPYNDPDGLTLAASDYQLVQSVYALPADCRSIRNIESPLSGRALIERSEAWMRTLVGWPAATGCVEYYSPVADAIDPASGAFLARQIQLYAVPTLAQNYALQYEALAAAFDGVTTAAGPLAFASASALIAGAKADLELEKPSPNLPLSASFETRFEAHIQSMIHLENDRQGPQEIRMDPHFTRHRIARVWRSLGGSLRVDDRF